MKRTASRFSLSRIKERMIRYGRQINTIPAFRAMSTRAKTYPITTAGLIIAARYGGGDIMLQTLNNEPWDIQRTVMFAAFGGTYAMTFGYAVYNVFYPSLGIARRFPFALALFDCTINSPFLYFPVYYLFREVTYNSKPKEAPADIVQHTYSTWNRSFWSDLKSVTAFWLPVNTFNFWIVPLHFRQPFMAVSGFAWAMILSNLRGDRPEDQE
mmetsp:Transcript_8880/g.13253  ORF Transcript_8880/g.13253 Transcript_8880/m.13253 type:complete len:212 (-) Transcript_8880:89-724(-)